VTQYETIKPPRFRKELVPGGYEYVIPPRRNFVIILFLAAWLSLWIFFGVTTIVEVTRTHEPFLIVWLLGWAAALLFVAVQILYMASGSEYVRSTGGDIEVGYRALLLHKSWRFRGSEIRSLRAGDAPDIFGRGSFNAWGYPLFMIKPKGAISFNFGARTIYAGAGIDRAEAELIVTDLLRSIPNAA
jgi:hypothetical protein